MKNSSIGAILGFCRAITVICDKAAIDRVYYWLLIGYLFKWMQIAGAGFSMGEQLARAMNKLLPGARPLRVLGLATLRLYSTREYSKWTQRWNRR